MSKRRVCDRCGKIILKNDSYINLKADLHEFGCVTYNFFEADLCEECREKFNELIGGDDDDGDQRKNKRLENA